MRLNETTKTLFEEFNAGTYHRSLSDFNIDIATLPFISNADGILPNKRNASNSVAANYFQTKDSEIKENKNFTYHIFLPRGKEKYNKAILLMHGLNEKSWRKYLPWATRLCENTGSPVILFPFAFHMNRAPQAWSQPRSMSNLMSLRKTRIDSITKSSFANVALSERLDSIPHRFYLSGYQTASDIFSLIESIKNGFHPLFKEGTNVDLFAYSIGAFLSQIMLIADDEHLLADSKLMMFCGGAVFQNMIGESKMIMDSKAFQRLLDYFINDMESDIQNNKPYTSLLKNTDLGKGFRAMIGEHLKNQTREDAFIKHAGSINAIGLRKDKVIPADKIFATLKGRDQKIATKVDILDFPFEYTHENPFPSGKDIDDIAVDSCFDNVFSKASEFLC